MKEKLSPQMIATLEVIFEYGACDVRQQTADALLRRGLIRSHWDNKKYTITQEGVNVLINKAKVAKGVS
jgi:predicted transcriptional regulator